MLDALHDCWLRQFPGSAPVAHQLRYTFRARWARFHSLPGAKRYPDDEAELGILLDRFNCILADLVRPEQTVLLLTTGYSYSWEPPTRYYAELASLDPDAVIWDTVAMHEIEADRHVPTVWHVFVSQRRFCRGVFDSIIRLIAENTLADIMIAASDFSWLLHPYDGGCDAILDTTARRDVLKAKFADWLSARADGL